MATWWLRMALLALVAAMCHAECVRMTVAMPCSRPENDGMACTLVGALCSSWFSQSDQAAYNRFIKRIYDMENDAFIDLSEGAIYSITPQSIAHGLNYKVSRVTPEKLRRVAGWTDIDTETESVNTLIDLLDAKIAENVVFFYNDEHAREDADLTTSLLYVRTVSMMGFYVRHDVNSVSVVPEVWEEIFAQRLEEEKMLIDAVLS